MAWRATVTRKGRLGIVWAIGLQEYRERAIFGDHWRTWEREDGGPFAFGTERHALAKAARLGRRRERADLREAEAKARAAVVQGGRPYVIGAGEQVMPLRSVAPRLSTPNPHVDRHVAFPEDP